MCAPPEVNLNPNASRSDEAAGNPNVEELLVDSGRSFSWFIVNFVPTAPEAGCLCPASLCSFIFNTHFRSDTHGPHIDTMTLVS
jgi:hypothetical protein